MRMPLAAKISARSGTSARGARTFNVVSDGRNGEVQKRPALVFSEGYGGLGSGLIDSPNGLMSTWDGAIVDENGCARIVGSGSIVAVPMTGYDETRITGMSDDGSVCCGWGIRTSDAKTRALRITIDGVEELAYPSGISGKTWAFGISGDGQTIVGGGMQSSTRAISYKWKDGVVTEIARTDAATLLEEGGAMGASHDGRYICGWHIRSSVRRGYIHDSITGVTTYKTLPSPYSASTEVKFLSISYDGSWVCGNAAEFPIAWNHQKNILQDIANGTFGFTTGVSDEGKYACGYYPLTHGSFFFKRTIYRYDGANDWQSLTPYAVGARVVSGTNVYVCVTEGTSGNTTPTGTGSGISDGTVVWDYEGATTDVITASARTDFSLSTQFTNALAISRYGNAVICEVTDTSNNLYLYRWNQCGGTFKNSENLGLAAAGYGEAVGRVFPKGAGCSGLAGNIAITQSNVALTQRAAKIRVLEQ